MQGFLMTLMAVVIGLASPAMARDRETATRLATVGAWLLVEVHTTTKEGAEIWTCNLQSGNSRQALEFRMMSARNTPPIKGLSGTVVVNATSTDFHFAKTQKARITLGDGRASYVAGGAELDKSGVIQFERGGNGRLDRALDRFLKALSGPITISDAKGKALAKYDAPSLGRIYPKLLDCAGF